MPLPTTTPGTLPLLPPVTLLCLCLSLPAAFLQGEHPCLPLLLLLSRRVSGGPSGFASGKGLLLHLLSSCLYLLSPSNAAMATLQPQQAVAAACLLRLLGNDADASSASLDGDPATAALPYDYLHHVLLRRGESWRQVMTAGDRALLLLLLQPFGEPHPPWPTSLEGGGSGAGQSKEAEAGQFIPHPGSEGEFSFSAVAQHPALVLFARMLHQVLQLGGPPGSALRVGCAICRLLGLLHSRPEVGVRASPLQPVLQHLLTSLDQLCDLGMGPEAAALVQELVLVRANPGPRTYRQAATVITSIATLTLLGASNRSATATANAGSGSSDQPQRGQAEDVCSSSETTLGRDPPHDGGSRRGSRQSISQPAPPSLPYPLSLPCYPVVHALLKGGTLMHLAEGMGSWQDSSAAATAAVACASVCRTLHAITQWQLLGMGTAVAAAAAGAEDGGMSTTPAVALPPELHAVLQQAATSLRTRLGDLNSEVARGAVPAVWELISGSGSTCWPTAELLLHQGVLLLLAVRLGQPGVAGPQDMGDMAQLLLLLVDRFGSSSSPPVGSASRSASVSSSSSSPPPVDARTLASVGELSLSVGGARGLVHNVLQATAASLASLLRSGMEEDKGGGSLSMGDILQSTWLLSRVQIKADSRWPVCEPSPHLLPRPQHPHAVDHFSAPLMSDLVLEPIELPPAPPPCMPAVRALLESGALAAILAVCCDIPAQGREQYENQLRACSLLHLAAWDHNLDGQSGGSGSSCAVPGSSGSSCAVPAPSGAEGDSFSFRQLGSIAEEEEEAGADAEAGQTLPHAHAHAPHSAEGTDVGRLTLILQTTCNMLCEMLASRDPAEQLQAVLSLQELTGLTGDDCHIAADLAVRTALEAGLAQHVASGLGHYNERMQEQVLLMLATLAARCKEHCPGLHAAGLPLLVQALLHGQQDPSSTLFLQGTAFLFQLSCCEELQWELRHAGLLHSAGRVLRLHASGSGSESGSLLALAMGAVANVYHHQQVAPSATAKAAAGEDADEEAEADCVGLMLLAQYPGLPLALRDILEAVLHGDARWQGLTWFLDSTVCTLLSLTRMPEYAAPLLIPPCNILPLLLEVLQPGSRTSLAARQAKQQGTWARVPLTACRCLLQLAAFPELRGMLIEGGTVGVLSGYLDHADARVVEAAQGALLELSHAPHEVLVGTLDGVQVRGSTCVHARLQVCVCVSVCMDGCR